MNQSTDRRPTDAELEVLRILWKRGPSTVRQLHDDVRREVGYTTTLKTVQIMTQKGLVNRSAKRPHIYTATDSKDSVQSSMIRDLIDRAFQGSAATLVMRALANESESPEELEKIFQMIDEVRRKQS